MTGQRRLAAVQALLFPGQGAQRAGMGRAWADTPSWRVVERLSAAVGRDVGGLLLDADGDTLQATRNAQLATFTLSLVALDALRSSGWGSQVAAVAGHSLGEYTALVAAGALTEEAAAGLVVQRGEAMQAAADAAPGTMAAVLALSPEQVEAAVSTVSGAWVANDNAPGQVVISGTVAGVAAAGEAAKAAGGKDKALPVGGAFHSPLMAGAQSALSAALGACSFADTALPVVANVDAAAHTDGAGWPARLGAQLCSRVRWRESLLALEGLGVDSFIEVGPGATLTGMVKRTLPAAARESVAAPEDTEKVSRPA